MGKTEIARRLAKLINAPFIKVEATKFTEVGFHGRDVDMIIKDLVEVSINNTKVRFALMRSVQRADTACSIAQTRPRARACVRVFVPPSPFW